MDGSPPNELRLHALCPRCRQATDCIQAYDIPVGIFALFFFGRSKQRIVGCPPCVRQSLLKYLFLSIPLANIFCWLYIPAYLGLMSASHTSEHPGVPAQYQYLIGMRPEDFQENQGARPGGWQRVLVVVLILAVVICAALFLLPALTAH